MIEISDFWQNIFSYSGNIFVGLSSAFWNDRPRPVTHWSKKYFQIFWTLSSVPEFDCGFLVVRRIINIHKDLRLEAAVWIRNMSKNQDKRFCINWIDTDEYTVFMKLTFSIRKNQTWCMWHTVYPKIWLKWDSNPRPRRDWSLNPTP